MSRGAARRVRVKGRKESGPFLALPLAVINSPAFLRLGPSSIRLLLDLGSQYRGNNNGDLSAAWGLMSKRGWKSKDTLNHALSELLSAGFIEKTRQGGRNKCSLFALDFQAIDECNGKLDVRATAVARNAWRGESSSARGKALQSSSASACG